jgi:cytochrome c-type biogenesis protein CcmH
MIWMYVALVAALALAPFGWAVWRGGRVRGRRDAALALHRAQLAELDRDLAEGRIMQAEHAAAKLEVQRRLLADAELGEQEAGRSGPVAIVLTAVLVPAVALFLYIEDGVPNYRQAAVQALKAASAATRAQEVARDEEMIEKLKAALATMDPGAERTREGYVLLGKAELSVGDLPSAADAWRKALAARFEPTLGAQTAEVISDAAGYVTPEAAALFKRALAEAPPTVPWRKAVEKRIAEVPSQ